MMAARRIRSHFATGSRSLAGAETGATAAMPVLQVPELTELFGAIIGVLIPLLIWAFCDLEKRRRDWQHRYRLQGLSRRKSP
jgi:hypothetical protein